MLSPRLSILGLGRGAQNLVFPDIPCCFVARTLGGERGAIEVYLFLDKDLAQEFRVTS